MPERHRGPRAAFYWNEEIAPTIKSGKRVVIAAHGNSIRALIKYLDNISDSDIVGLNIPNGIPLVCMNSTPTSSRSSTTTWVMPRLLLPQPLLWQRKARPDGLMT